MMRDIARVIARERNGRLVQRVTNNYHQDHENYFCWNNKQIYCKFPLE